MDNEILKECMRKGFLLDKEMLGIFSSYDFEKIVNVIDIVGGIGLNERVITKKVFMNNFERIKNAFFSFNSNDSFFLDFLSDNFKENFLYDKNNSDSIDVIKDSIGRLKVKLINAPRFPQRKISVSDFVKHFRSRYEILRSVLEARDFDGLCSIRKIGEIKGNYYIIGSVLKKRVTKNKNIMFVVEDLTGYTNILVNQNKEEVFLKAKEVLLDDVVAFGVSGSRDFLFCNDIVFPEASLPEKRRASDDIWVAFISDLHCGSSMFLENNFLKFVKWINGGGDKYKDISKKVKYLFVAGDLIDGVNHYPGQEKDLNVFSSVGQYAMFESFIKLIRSDIEIIACPGNHDSVWVGEPQPIIPEKWSSGLYKLDNFHLVPNPSLIEIEGGFKILMYHGASINAFIDEIPEIRSKYGHSSPSVVVKEIIKRSHIAPIHGLVDYIPCEVDPMVINVVPDIILTGDQHCVDIGCVNNIMIFASSCWQSITPFMEKLGIVPDPCKVPLFNLKTREVKILDFSDVFKEIEWNSDPNIFCDLNNEKMVFRK